MLVTTVVRSLVSTLVHSHRTSQETAGNYSRTFVQVGTLERTVDQMYTVSYQKVHMVFGPAFGGASGGISRSGFFLGVGADSLGASMAKVKYLV